MSTRFTQGPWRLSVRPENNKSIYDLYGDLVATCTLGQSGYEADARLIAAAPEMFELLEKICLQSPEFAKEIWPLLNKIKP